MKCNECDNTDRQICDLCEQGGPTYIPHYNANISLEQQQCKQENYILTNGIDKDKKYDVTICFANGIQKKPIKMPGYMVMEVLKAIKTSTSASIIIFNMENSGLAFPMSNVNELYWAESKEEVIEEGSDDNETEGST